MYNLPAGATRNVPDRPAVVTSPILEQTFVAGLAFWPVLGKFVTQIITSKYIDLGKLLVVNLVQKEPEP